MKGNEADRFCRKYLLPRLPGFEANRGLLYRSPIQDLLNAFRFESSAYDRSSFYFWVFVQPLYVPHTHIVFTFGTRLGFGWEVNKDNESEVAGKLLTCMHDDGIPWLDRLRTPTDFVDNIVTIDTVNPENRHVLQAKAYSQALIGETQGAVETLNHLFATHQLPTADAPEWDHKFYNEVGTFRETLLRDPFKARGLLNLWEEETKKSLRL